MLIKITGKSDKFIGSKYIQESFIEFDVRRTQYIILGFLWYSLGVPVVLKGDLFSKQVSSYVCIFCAILNNLAHVIYVISNIVIWQSRASLVPSRSTR